MAIADRVFLFDILALGDSAFDRGLKSVIESTAVQKVIKLDNAECLIFGNFIHFISGCHGINQY